MLTRSFTEWIKYILLGLIQGVTEPLPISSSGHVIIFRNIFGLSIPDEINFNIWVNFGSFLAIVFFYRLFLKDIITGFCLYLFKHDLTRKKDFQYAMFVVVATIPAAIMGFFLKPTIDAHLSTLLTVAICEIITGLLLLFISYFSKRADKDDVTLLDSVFMGLAQVIGLLPGISRSGATTSIAVANKVDLTKALRFSFMMYLPISLASMILGMIDMNMTTTYWTGYIGAFFMSILGTYFALKLFFHLVKKDNLKYFGVYCLTIGILVLIYLGGH
ncbi:MAG: undecaprenyl-diphosphate phosphatase [Bacilli bacterium]